MKRSSEPEPAFYAAAAVLTRKIETTRARLAARGVRCTTSFALAMRPEVAAMRASIARVAGATAPTQPSFPVWRGTIEGRR